MNRSRRTSDRGRQAGRPSRRGLEGYSDEQLVEFVLDGRDDAFEVLFERHVADSLWYAREVLGSWGEAEEAVRHSFAAAHAYLETRGHETEFAPWLNTILGNHCLSMLQARTPGPSSSAADANVVDLDEWRLRRKLFGAALPVAPSAALRDGVMAACGIGAGAATAGAPLLGGMAANVAVVAVLAGGLGVAGNAVSDRAAAFHADTPAPVERVVDAASGPRGETQSRIESSNRLRSSLGAAGPGRDSTPRPTPQEVGPRDRAQAELSPAKSLPSTTDSPPGPTVPELDSTTLDVPAAAPPPVESTLQSVVDVVETQVPAVGDLSEGRLPDSIELPEIGDDPGVTAIEPPVDVRALLSQGADAPPQ